jgi:ATP-dependent DNA helicase RecG
MVRMMKEHGQQAPQFEETDGGFAVTLVARAPSASQPELAPPAPAAQHQRVEKMLGYLKDNGRITSRDYQELCPDVSPESLRRDFVDMVERGAILRVGDKRGTYYILK